jgi:hypothetical protein
MKKKALSWNMKVIIAFAAMIVSVIIILAYLSSVQNAAETAGKDTACQTSIDFMITQKDFKIDQLGVTQLKCPTKYVQGKSAVAKQQIAEEMASCWGKFRKGEYPLFDLESGNYCVVCSSLEFKNPQKIAGFTEYLIDTPAPRTGTSYFNYLTNNKDHEVIKNFAQSDFAQQETLSTTENLAVIFLMHKEVDDYTKVDAAYGFLGSIGVSLVLAPFTGGSSVVINIVRATAVGGAGYLVGTYETVEDTQSSILLWPYKDIPQLNCNRLEGRATSLEFVE